MVPRRRVLRRRARRGLAVEHAVIGVDDDQLAGMDVRRVAVRERSCLVERAAHDSLAPIRKRDFPCAAPARSHSNGWGWCCRHPHSVLPRAGARIRGLPELFCGDPANRMSHPERVSVLGRSANAQLSRMPSAGRPNTFRYMITPSSELSASLQASPVALLGRPYAIRRLCVLVGVGVPDRSPATAQRGPERPAPTYAQPTQRVL